jgi:hypothetical protein
MSVLIERELQRINRQLEELNERLILTNETLSVIAQGIVKGIELMPWTYKESDLDDGEEFIESAIEQAERMGF